MGRSPKPPILINSRQNPRIKELVKLRDRRYRAKTGKCLVDGAREISRALAAGVSCPAAFICEELIESPEERDACKQLQRGADEVFLITALVYKKIAFGDRDDGLVMLAAPRRRKLEDVKLPAAPLLAVVEGVEKPGNLGAILRSADGAGVDGLVVADGGTDLFNPNTIRASLGTVFGDWLCEATAEETKHSLTQEGFKIFAARPDGATNYTDVDLTGKTALVFGSEASGLSDAWHGDGITPIKLPMRGIADSLNVSTTAAILFYEALRQRLALADSR
jgi:TrmH family RNA methyltransferase